MENKLKRITQTKMKKSGIEGLVKAKSQREFVKKLREGVLYGKDEVSYFLEKLNGFRTNQGYHLRFKDYGGNIYSFEEERGTRRLRYLYSP